MSPDSDRMQLNVFQAYMPRPSIRIPASSLSSCISLSDVVCSLENVAFHYKDEYPSPAERRNVKTGRTPPPSNEIFAHTAYTSFFNNE